MEPSYHETALTLPRKIPQHDNAFFVSTMDNNVDSQVSLIFESLSENVFALQKKLQDTQDSMKKVVHRASSMTTSGSSHNLQEKRESISNNVDVKAASSLSIDGSVMFNQIQEENYVYKNTIMELEVAIESILVKAVDQKFSILLAQEKERASVSENIKRLEHENEELRKQNIDLKVKFQKTIEFLKGLADVNEDNDIKMRAFVNGLQEENQVLRTMLKLSKTSTTDLNENVSITSNANKNKSDNELK